MGGAKRKTLDSGLNLLIRFTAEELLAYLLMFDGDRHIRKRKAEQQLCRVVGGGGVVQSHRL